MISKILMPAGGQTAAESMIVKWHVSEGDAVNRGDVLFEMETDKATLEVESYAKGNLLKICYAAGEKVENGKVVAYIGNPGEKIEEIEAAEGKADESEDDYKPILKQIGAGISGPDKKSDDHNIPDRTVEASPAARLTARKNEIDLMQIYAKLNRPVKAKDIIAAKSASAINEYEVIVPSAMRRTISRKMLQSVHEAPQFTVTIKPDMSGLIELRSRLNGALTDSSKISYNDLLVKCVCLAVKKVPTINSVYSDDEIRLMRNINVGIAVALHDGLIVPVIKKAQDLSIKEISEASSMFIQKAKSGKLDQKDIQDGTITISNLGMYGIHHFTALVNRPENAIIAVGAILETPVGVNGMIELRPVCEMTASFDHRMIDGATGAMFMGELKRVVESPFEILL